MARHAVMTTGRYTHSTWFAAYLNSSSSDCLPHNKTPDKDGYWITSYSHHGKSVCVRAHRLVYALANNVSLPSMKGKVVRHLCNNPTCLNPAHLRLGTHQDNLMDSVAAGTTKRLTDEQVTQMISEYIPFVVTVKYLAAKYEVSPQLVHHYISGKRRRVYGNP